MIKVEYKHTEIAVKKKLGQNFLTDRNITRKIVTESETNPDDTILEIGPGFGALTREISTITPRFTVVEKDPKLASFIRNEYPELTVIEGDFLTVDLKKIAGEKPLRVLGNIPYAITSPILFKLLENRHILLSATLMMQHEVALRITAKPRTKDYGILAVQMQAFCETKYLFRVGRKVFRPQPGVDSAVISMKPKVNDPVSDREGFSRFVRCAFHQRRKTLQNNLKKTYELDRVESSVLKQRAEELSIDEFFRLFEQIRPLMVSSADPES
ncbi:16S rRNA (adenine(1518)-N(6)/adenine(1519)-N(6))-dimethyltransferase RsmA [Chlorobium phaeobacteroides]|uniref:Ribosomal RNA small subunit methyltransferase A n=1 Tax=Chlorobium phaeobacteroides (strain DSM 266 / SMG 266 / 2430) TaxID=290317 RepID=RSMA_CHLPD|nr:16S rRNA (adenine(1518)-N(6)/adenine(1519)-N(6))-dimethyltransferase RsmA [Chlorobium phaeobacteroides]A1BFM9.1 RecName: Full=Ribosomal RNA small subunit methyltransferase A; AltName: Full=16S rRNA (adenine(1518)-N(6)/adenine(1519)-N(6))-dimethyltransferase; AltName: Full=16S rRNA dimethyladenosine transferase; AltName: Full=16S rRNA dimethylase; AltName: Full=S-adenosylmethionine-6-N', N'-adenosyl(rRNA) dimethyltransferase [Chlorobium phaeobacteroides DSM 266]ABL65206.1 dimethyladenosine tran